MMQFVGDGASNKSGVIENDDFFPFFAGYIFRNLTDKAAIVTL